MINPYDINTLYSFFFKAAIRAKRTRVLFLISMLPFLVVVIAKVAFSLRGGAEPAFDLFVKVGATFYFQFMIPLMALFFGAAVLNEEVDNKTLIYLTTSPVS